MTCQNLLRAAGAAALLVALSACGGDGEPAVTAGSGTTASSGTTGGSGATGTGTDKVTVKDFSFTPATATVKAGTTVTWTFQDDVDHNVEPVGGAEPAVSPDLQGGTTYTFTFEKPGTYAYRCGIHNSMTGSVVVTA